MKSILIPLATAVVCILAISQWTDGFRAFTVFSYTLNKAGDMPRSFPDMELMNQEGEKFRIRDEGKYVLTNFVYLNCPDVCHKVNNRLETIYHLIPSEYFSDDLKFVTISFDPERDDVDRIKKYRNLFDKDDISGWDFAIPYHSRFGNLDEYLKDAGIWAVPAPASRMINHSVYIFLISPENKVITVFDPGRESDEEIANGIRKVIQKKKIHTAG